MASPASETVPLQFEPFTCRVEVEFWFDLERRKLHEYKDDVSPVAVWGSYATSSHAAIPSFVTLGVDAFGSCNALPFHFPVEGTLVNTNTMEELKRYDRRRLLEDAGAKIWESITTGAWLDNPGALTQFLLLCFADLKSHKFHYCAAFPVLLPAESFRRRGPPLSIAQVFNDQQQRALSEGYQALRGLLPDQTSPLAAAQVSAFVVSLEKATEAVQVHPVSVWKELSGTEDRRVWLAVADPCAAATTAGWPLRNVLFALTHQFELEGTVNVLCYREVPGRHDISHSFAMEVCVSKGRLLKEGATSPPCAGWPADNKLKPVDLSPLMDAEKLSNSSATLNLSLMKWRMLPDLDLQLFENTKCLLIGAGTLGCNVARTLMMWGITRFTFVDYGKVSYSNPVRQTLFDFNDAREGAPKAQAAAQACRRIYPAVQVGSHVLSIPMPGHPVDAKRRAAVSDDVAQLSALIEEADVVFLLTDSRESRWLPTLLCSKHNKLCVNAALGFGGYMVMRHGVRTEAPEQRLGCYFCNEVTAPRDSLSDRTLDQQCTVTRPGVSAMASALAVELMAACLQHPLKGAAPADKEHDDATSLLGLVPHQIRGQVDNFQQHLMYGRAYDKCIACSASVVEAYEKQGFDFVASVLNEPELLEELTGLKAVKEEVDKLLEGDLGDMEAIDDEDEEWEM